MSQSDKAQFNKAAAAQSARSNEVRALAKERARRRARISKRQVNRRRGILGAGLLVGLCIVLWVLVGITSLSAVVAGVATGVVVVYLGCFGYIINSMATATAQDEEAIEKINQRLKSKRGSGRLSQSRRPSAPKGMNRPQDRAETEKSARKSARPGSVAVGDVGAGAGATTRDAGAARVEELLGSEAEKASQVKVNAQWPRPEVSSSNAAGTSGDALVDGRRPGLVMSLSPEVIEDSINVDVISSVSAERVNVNGASTGAGLVSAEAVSAGAVSAGVVEGRDGADVERNGEAAGSDIGVSQDVFWEFTVEETVAAVSPAAASPAAASPAVGSSEVGSTEVGSPPVDSPALRQPVIADPYAVVSSPYAATSTNGTDGSRDSRGSRAVDAGAVGAVGAAAGADDELPSYTAKPRAIERRVVTPYEAPAVPEAAVPYRPKEIGERFDNEAEGGDSSDNTDGLLGGSSLDALLDRRRA